MCWLKFIDYWNLINSNVSGGQFAVTPWFARRAKSNATKKGYRMRVRATSSPDRRRRHSGAKVRARVKPEGIEFLDAWCRYTTHHLLRVGFSSQSWWREAGYARYSYTTITMKLINWYLVSLVPRQWLFFQSINLTYSLFYFDKTSVSWWYKMNYRFFWFF